MQELAVSDDVRAHVGSPKKFWGRLDPAHFRQGRGWPLETRYSSTWFIILSFVDLGQAIWA